MRALARVTQPILHICTYNAGARMAVQRPATHTCQAGTQPGKWEQRSRQKWMLHCNHCNGSLHGKFSNLETMNGFMKGIQHKGHLANWIMNEMVTGTRSAFTITIGRTYSHNMWQSAATGKLLGTIWAKCFGQRKYFSTVLGTGRIYVTIQFVVLDALKRTVLYQIFIAG